MKLILFITSAVALSSFAFAQELPPYNVYSEHINTINIVIIVDIILRVLLVGISFVLVGVLLIGKLLVLLNRDDKELDRFFYQKSVKVPSHKLYLLVVMYIFTILLYFSVGRYLLREYLREQTGSSYNFLDKLRPEIDFYTRFFNIKPNN